MRVLSVAAKVPESPYTPRFWSERLEDPNKVNAGRPTASTGAKEVSAIDGPKSAPIDSEGPFPFGSTYDRVAGGTSHWLGTSLRFVPNDFKMKTYGAATPIVIGRSSTKI
jgi:hypothetical protein